MHLKLLARLETFTSAVQNYRYKRMSVVLIGMLVGFVIMLLPIYLLLRLLLIIIVAHIGIYFHIDYPKVKRNIEAINYSPIVIQEKLNQIKMISEDGQIRYKHGNAYVIKFSTSELNDIDFNVLFEEFLNHFDNYVYDIHVLNVSQGNHILELIKKTNIYNHNVNYMKERVEFYKRQYEYATDYSKLFEFYIVVYSAEQSSTRISNTLRDINSDNRLKILFKDGVRILDKKEVIEFIKRDLYVDFDVLDYQSDEKESRYNTDMFTIYRKETSRE